MKSQLRDRAIRKIASGLIDEFSATEIRQIADELLHDNDFHRGLGDVLYQMGIALESITSASSLRSAAPPDLSDRDRMGLSDKLYRLAKRKRWSKTRLAEAMTMVAPHMGDLLRRDMSIRVMIDTFAGSVAKQDMRNLVLFMEGPKSDAYLDGIMKRPEGGRYA